MSVQCSQCGKQLLLSDSAKQSLKKLEKGKKARIKCAQCEAIVLLDATMLQTDLPLSKSRAENTVRPPGPPDLSWLKDAAVEDKEVLEDIPRALLLVPPGKMYDVIATAISALGYQIETAATAQEAIEKIEFIQYSTIFLDCDYESKPLESATFYRFISSMNMTKRRYIFLTLIGSTLHTLYNLEAVSYSANLTVNKSDISHLATILRKAIPEYETLFGPYMEELQVHGK